MMNGQTTADATATATVHRQRKELGGSNSKYLNDYYPKCVYVPRD